MSNAAINLSTLNANTVLASTFSQAVYPNAGGASFAPPAGFTKVTFEFAGRKSDGFAAETFVNKTTGQVVIAYRGSDGPGEAVGVAQYSASTGTWDPQFTDATNYAKQAQAAALKSINDYRDETGKPRLTANDITPLVTGHSLGGLLGQVVSKMFGWPAEVFDSLGGGKLVTTQEFADQAKALGQVDVNGNVIDRDVSGIITNYAASSASSFGTQLGSTVDIPALGTMGGMSTIAILAGIVAVPVVGLGALFAGDQFLGKHKVTAIEQAMYGLAALKPLVADEGELRPQNMTLAQATGQNVSEGGSNPNVVALVNAQNQVVAYVEVTGSAPQIVVARGANAGTSLSLGRAGAAENSPIEIIQTNPDHTQQTLSEADLLSRLKPADKDVISSQVFDDGSRIDTTTTADGKQTTTTYDDNGAVFNRSTLERRPNADGETWLRQEFDGAGKLVEVQTAVYDSKRGITEVDVYRDGKLLAHTVVEGQATQAQLDKALALSEQISKATSLSDAADNTSDSGDSLLETLGVEDGGSSFNTNADIKMPELALGLADTGYSGSNMASAPVFDGVTQYANWLRERGQSSLVPRTTEQDGELVTDMVADPSLIALQDGALAVVLARQNPSAVNVLRALQDVILAGGVLSESFKKSTADSLGTSVEGVNAWVSSGGVAITSFLSAMENPTPQNVIAMAQSMMRFGGTVSPSFQKDFSAKLGIDAGTFSQMLAYGGAGLAVAAVLKDPTPQSIVAATQQVTSIMTSLESSPSLQNLNYTLGYATTVFSVYNFVKNPSNQTAVSAMLNIGMMVCPEVAMPLAAVLTIGEFDDACCSEEISHLTYDLAATPQAFKHIGQQLIASDLQCITQTNQHRQRRLIACSFQSTKVRASNICTVRKLFLRKPQNVSARFERRSESLNQK